MNEKVNHIREQLPAVKHALYFNTGTAGPQPVQVEEAMVQSLKRQTSIGRIDDEYYTGLGKEKAEARRLIAQILGCDPTEVALTHNTSEGVNIASLGIQWNQGDEVITNNLEHLAGVVPPYVLKERYGVTLKIADLLGRAENAAQIIGEMITPRTRLIIVSHVSYNTGEVLPVREICELAHKQGVLVVVDGAQSFGAVPINVQSLGCDFYSVPGQKWICGPEGTGALYTSKAALPQIRLTFAGYGSIDKYNLYGGFLPKENGQRFEQGTVNPAMIAGQLAACRWLIEEVGLDWAYERIVSLSRRLHEGLSTLAGVRVLTKVPASGLITFAVEGINPQDIVKALRQQNIIIRSLPFPDAVRASTGFYNTEDEVDELIRAVSQLEKA